MCFVLLSDRYDIKIINCLHDTVCALTCLNGTICFIVSYAIVIFEHCWEVHET